MKYWSERRSLKETDILELNSGLFYKSRNYPFPGVGRTIKIAIMKKEEIKWLDRNLIDF
jgi:hypothetical protein